MTNFLLHGGSTQTSALEIFLLDKSERSLHFAHRLYWFLRSFAPDLDYRSELCGAMQGLSESTLLRAVETQGRLAGTLRLFIHPMLLNSFRTQPFRWFDCYRPSLLCSALNQRHQRQASALCQPSSVCL